MSREKDNITGRYRNSANGVQRELTRPGAAYGTAVHDRRGAGGSDKWRRRGKDAGTRRRQERVPSTRQLPGGVENRELANGFRTQPAQGVSSDAGRLSFGKSGLRPRFLAVSGRTPNRNGHKEQAVEFTPSQGHHLTFFEVVAQSRHFSRTAFITEAIRGSLGWPGVAGGIDKGAGGSRGESCQPARGSARRRSGVSALCGGRGEAKKALDLISSLECSHQVRCGREHESAFR